MEEGNHFPFLATFNFNYAHCLNWGWLCKNALIFKLNIRNKETARSTSSNQSFEDVFQMKKFILTALLSTTILSSSLTFPAIAGGHSQQKAIGETTPH